MSRRQDIPKLEALLARVQLRAQMPRRQAARPAVEAPPIPTVPPTADARAALEEEMHATPPPPPPQVAHAPIEATSETRVVAEAAVVPLESRAQLVGGQQAELIEIDEAELLAAEAEPAQEIIVDEEVEFAPPPPSSKRPIPMEAIAEAQAVEPPPPPPPESGKLVAAVPAFDDDFTGVREASHQLPPLEANEPSIEIQHVEPPRPAVRHEMEAELGGAHDEQRISDVAPVVAPVALAASAEPIRPEHTPAKLPSGETVVVITGGVTPFAPQTFGELLDATLNL